MVETAGIVSGTQPGCWVDDLTYTFEGQDDASRYLRELALLWGAWVVGLAGLMLTNAIVLLVWGVGTVTVLVVMARPIQRRAERLVPDNKVEGGKVDTVLRGGTTRDRAIRDLAYGTEPLRIALRTVGFSERWVLVRHVIVALTVLGLVYVIANPGI